MTSKRVQEERLDYLLEKFKEDSVRYKDMDTAGSCEEKRRILRSLMNIRMPRRMDGDVLKVQDEFLSEEANEKGIITLMEIPTVIEQYKSRLPHADKISLWQGDITRLAADAIVNAANLSLTF